MTLNDYIEIQKELLIRTKEIMGLLTGINHTLSDLIHEVERMKV